MVKFEDCSLADVRTYEPKLFATFENECQQAKEIKKYITFSVSLAGADWNVGWA